MADENEVPADSAYAVDNESIIKLIIAKEIAEPRGVNIQELRTELEGLWPMQLLDRAAKAGVDEKELEQVKEEADWKQAEQDAEDRANFNVNALPPLPEPNVRTMQREEIGGWCLIIGIALACLIAVHVSQAKCTEESARVPLCVAVALVYLEAIIAILSTLRLLHSNPGVVVRSADTCLPFPREVSKSCTTAAAFHSAHRYATRSCRGRHSRRE